MLSLSSSLSSTGTFQAGHSKIDAALARRGRKLNIKADEVLQELAKLAFFDVRDIFRPDGSMKELSELDDVSAAAVSGFEVVMAKDEDGTRTRPVLKKIRLADKAAALQKLGRHLNLFSGTGDEPDDRLQELIDAMNAGPVQPGWTISPDESTAPPASGMKPNKESDYDQSKK